MNKKFIFVIFLFIFLNKISAKDNFIKFVKNFEFKFKNEETYIYKNEIFKIQSFKKNSANININFFYEIIEIDTSYFEIIELTIEQKDIFSKKANLIKKEINKNKTKFVIFLHSFFKKNLKSKTVNISNLYHSIPIEIKKDSKNKNKKIDALLFDNYLRIIIPDYPSLLYFTDNITCLDYVNRAIFDFYIVSNKDTFLIEKDCKTAYHFKEGGYFKKIEDNEISLNFFKEIIIKKEKASINIKIEIISLFIQFVSLIILIILYFYFK